ncbi:MBOAT family protein [Azospirillum sp.]|uniref:MBOAT family O-acyltransferase n=1 Tax=Azospirillum sp. TaxID=34012 RepID=UPI002D23A5DE|nr:MBOAT family protein [Azospirillum sp.]HYD64552.1 MBOAT family protein [Azospirillum sp.]
MLFNSAEFLFVFLPVTLAGFYILRRLRNVNFYASWLFAASMVFYGYWYPQYLPLIMGSITFNYGIGLAVGRATRWRRPLAVFGIAANLFGLGYFKYTNFLVDNLNAVLGSGLSVEALALPLGISFFTFQKIAYLIDVYTGRPAERNYLAYGTFVMFFPQLIAGPIVHHSEILPQLRRIGGPQPVLTNLAVGLTVLTFGLFKKAVIADGMAVYANAIFTAANAGQALSLAEAWLGALAYTLQLYFDFSGYSDMAIGLGLMFGIRLPVNFWSPYKATSIIDFWRRWHITLSRFLRDYLYIPLGGNRKGPARRHVNLFLTMLLGGIWHGAGWTFVIWGALHGASLTVNHLWRVVRPTAGRSGATARGASWLLTFTVVVIGWVFFRAESVPVALGVLRGMAGLNALLPAKAATLAMLAQGFAAAGLLLTLCLIAPNTLQLMRSARPALNIPAEEGGGPPAWLAWRPSLRWSVAMTGLALAALLNLTQISEFLYFDF